MSFDAPRYNDPSLNGRTCRPQAPARLGVRITCRIGAAGSWDSAIETPTPGNSRGMRRDNSGCASSRSWVNTPAASRHREARTRWASLNSTAYPEPSRAKATALLSTNRTRRPASTPCRTSRKRRASITPSFARYKARSGRVFWLGFSPSMAFGSTSSYRSSKRCSAATIALKFSLSTRPDLELRMTKVPALVTRRDDGGSKSFSHARNSGQRFSAARARSNFRRDSAEWKVMPVISPKQLSIAPAAWLAPPVRSGGPMTAISRLGSRRLSSSAVMSPSTPLPTIARSIDFSV